jgi:membrane protein YqaA with SNARE-associated domain
MKNWFKAIHTWSLHWAATKWGAWALFICAFADASFLPLPTPIFFLTLTLLNISKAYRYALLGTLGVFFGALAGYAVGHFTWLNANGAFSGFAQFMFNTIPGFSEAIYNDIYIQFERWNFWILFIASFMPVPFNGFSILSGVFGINIIMFCIAILLGQGLRYYLFALLILKLGPKVKKLFEFNLKPVAIIAVACVAIVIVVLKTL